MSVDFKGDALNVVDEFAEAGNMDALDLLVRYYVKVGKPNKAYDYMLKMHEIMTNKDEERNVEHCLAAARKLMKLSDIANFNVEDEKATRELRKLIK